MELKILSDDINYYSPWMEVNAFDWTPLTKGQPIIKFKKNTVIYNSFETNKYTYIIKKGRVRLSIFSRQGDEGAISVAQKGCMIGEFSLFDDNQNFSLATTIVDTELYRINKVHFFDVLSKNHQVQANLYNSLIRKIRILSSQFETLSFRKSTSRIAISLLMLVDAYGIRRNNGITLSIKFTHQELANITGLCRVTVSNFFRELMNEGIISKSNGHLVIKDIARLIDYVYEDE